jgi:hypothetical protein
MPKYEIYMRFNYVVETDDIEKTMNEFEFPLFNEAEAKFIDNINTWREVPTVDVIGYYTDELNCVSCATEGEPATSEALPDGFTCATCEVVVNV